MFNFLKAIADHRRARDEDAAQEWRRLLNRAALTDDLKPAEALRLAELHETMGGGADLEALAVDLRRYRALAAVADTAKGADRDAATAAGKVDAYDAETAAIVAAHETLIDQRGTARAKLAGAVASAQSRKDQATAAGKERDTIEARQWRYFGGEDPAVAQARASAEAAQLARVRYLRHATADVYDLPGSIMARTIIIEGFIASPELCGDLAGCELRCASGQDPAEFARLRGVAHRRGPAYGYLIHRDPDGKRYPRLVNYRDLIEYFEDAKASEGRFNPRQRFYIPHPGQTEAELKDMVRELAAAHEGYLKRSGHGRPMTVAG